MDKGGGVLIYRDVESDNIYGPPPQLQWITSYAKHPNPKTQNLKVEPKLIDSATTDLAPGGQTDSATTDLAPGGQTDSATTDLAPGGQTKSASTEKTKLN
jgi:hypothetical protein